MDVPTMTDYSWNTLKDNPRFYWSFNETGNTDNALDLVRGQTNDELVPQADARRGASRSENLAYASRLDGGGDNFSATALGDHEMPGAWAVEAWVQTDGSLAGTRRDYLVYAEGNNPALIYDFGDDGVDNEIELFGGGRTDGGPTVDDNGWHHIVATFYGNGAGFGVADRVDMAIDGVVTTVTRGGFSSAFNLQDGFIVGSSNIADFFQGQLDEVALYDLSGLSQAQVAARTQQIADHYQRAGRRPTTMLQYASVASYAIDPGTPTGGGAYADPGRTKLTDGIIGSTESAAWATGEWVGWSNVDPILTFDLGRQTMLDSLFLDYLVANGVGIHAPDSMLVEFSKDGSDFASIPSILSTGFNNFDPGGRIGWNRRLVLDLGMTGARYVRLSFTNDQEWTFLGEAQFVEWVPEPGSLSLLGLGLVALARRRRRG